MKALLLAAAALCAVAPASACPIVYGSGRNTGPVEVLALWDAANKTFNTAVVERLAQAGLEAEQTWVPIGALQPPEVPAFLLRQAQARGCRRIVDTAVFESAAEGRLVLRLRVHPVLGGLGPQRPGATLQIGDPLYTSQRDFDAGNRRALDAPRLKQLAREMTEGFLKSKAAVAVPSQ